MTYDSTQKIEAAKADQRSIDDRFVEFHRQNPRVYTELVRLCRIWRKRHGDRRLGVGMIWEVMRWNVQVETTAGADEFKLNNDFRSRYSRLIMAQEADLADVFEIRELKS